MKKKAPAPIPSPREQFPSKDLARLWRIPFSQETEPSRVEVALRERIKELNCFYAISRLAEHHPDSMSDLLSELVTLLPFSWQYPEITCARIVFQGQAFRSRSFKVTRWRLGSQITVYGEPCGEVEIFYLAERPPADEGPFLREERALLDAIAEQIRTLSQRISAEQELKEINRRLTVEQQALQETNTALKTVLARIEDEKQEIYHDLHANVEKVLMPILNALTLELPRERQKFIDLLRQSLNDITSPFTRRLSSNFQSLTPTEVHICGLIRAGMRTKEIAQLRGVAKATIDRHRENIRRKLNIANADVNLATWLQSNMEEGKRG